MTTPIPTYQSLFTRDLEISFGLSAGRALVAELEAAHLATFGAVNGLTLALQLQASSEESDATLSYLMQRASSDRRLVSLVLVALEPEITRHGSKGLRVALLPSQLTDLYLATTDVLREELTDRDKVAHAIVRRTRNLSRKPQGARVVTETLTTEHEIVDPSTCSNATSERVEILRETLATGAVSRADMELLWTTRVDGVSLKDYAERVGLAYSAARMRRHRIEQRLAQLILTEEQR